MTREGTMSDMANRPIRKEVIKQFVVRKRERGIVLEVLGGNIESPSCQHILVVASRSRGKTMLLTCAAAELRTDDALSGCLLPVRFMEESQKIFNLADFWLETLFHLVRESAAQDPELARELRETHAALSNRWREQALEEHTHAAVLEAADRIGRKLVLIVENIGVPTAALREASSRNPRPRSRRATTRSCCSPPPPVGSRVWTMRGSHFSSCSGSSGWNRWLPKIAAACGKSSAATR